MDRSSGFHDADPRIIPVQESMVLRGEIFQDLTFGLGDVFQGPQQFQMGIPYIGDHGGIRERNVLHGSDLSQAPHAHFHHGHFRILPDGQEGLGQADFIVEIGLGLDHPIFLSQYSSDAVLGRSLAVAAGDGDHCQSLLFQPPAAGDLLVGFQGIVHLDAPVRRYPFRHF